MKIRQLEIEGFRSLKNVTWSPGDLNVVIGPNGTGKSNLLRVLELLSAAAQGRLGKYIQSSGGMEPLVWDGRASGITLRVETLPAMGDRWNNPLAYDFELARLGTGSSYRIEREYLQISPPSTENESPPAPYPLIERHNVHARVFGEHGLDRALPESAVSEEETILALVSGPLAPHELITPFQKQLLAWVVYHDVLLHAGAPVRQPVVARREETVAADGQNLISVLHTLYTGDRNFEEAIDIAMRAAFGDDYEKLVFPPAADQRIQLRVRWKTLRREQPATDLSDGTLRFLFLLAVLASPSPAPVIAIDEPETGLHPAMFPIIAEYAIAAAERAQIILTTHSDQFLSAFSDTPPTTTVASWAEGETSLRTVDGDELRYWLGKYSLGSLFRSGELEQMV
jgi:predicted ATPase